MLLLLLSWKTVREVYKNHEVVMFQPWTGNSPDLGNVAYWYVAILLITTPPFLSTAQCPPEGETHSWPLSLSITTRPGTTHDHPTTQVSPVYFLEYQYHHVPHLTGSSAHLSVSHLNWPLPTPTTLRCLIQVHPTVPCPHHAFRIPVVAPLLPPKYILTYTSAVSEPHFSATMDHGTTHIPCSSSPYRKPHK